MAAFEKTPAGSAKKKRATKPADRSGTYATGDRKLKESIWEAPDDLDRMRVWADLLLEQGDPRGEVLQLNLLAARTDEQQERALALAQKLGGALVGPARPWLDGWSFDRRGLVDHAGCDAQDLIDGWEEIAWLHPRLTLMVSFRKQLMATMAKLVELPLARIHFLRMETGLNDRAVAVLGPALEGVRNLSLAGSGLTHIGLAIIAPHLESLERLHVGAHISDPAAHATSNSFAHVIANAPALRNLEYVTFGPRGRPDDAHLAMVRMLPKMKEVVVRSR